MEKRQLVVSSVILLVLVLIVASIVLKGRNEPSNNQAKDENSCFSDNDCVKDSCCHANGCVAIGKAPKCSGVFCTQVCEPGTLDCGQGSCKCVNNKCEAALNG